MSTSSERAIKLIEEEENIEVLRGISKQVVWENARLQQVIDRTLAEQAARAQLQLNIEEQVKILKRKLFGRSQEHREKPEEKRKSQKKAELFSLSAFPAPEEPKSKKEKWQQIPERQISHGMSEEELVAESVLREIAYPSAEQWEEIPGAFDKVTKIQIIERSYEKEVHLKKKYKLKDEFNPDPDEKSVIITAPGPEALLPEMSYSTEVVASVVSDKYISHMPLDRQTREMASLGLPGIKNQHTLSVLCLVGGFI